MAKTNKKQTKVFVLDTNVLLNDSEAIFKFGNAKVVIPWVCLLELDTFKKDASETGRNARQAARALDELREKGSLEKGVDLENGGSIQILHAGSDLLGIDLTLPDNQILTVCKGQLNVTLVSCDINLRVRADGLGIPSEDYKAGTSVSSDGLYTGYREFVVPKSDIDEFYQHGELEMPDVEFHPNEYVLLQNEENLSNTALARYDGNLQFLVPLIALPKDGVWGLKPKNMQQNFALDLLLNPDIKLVTLSGIAGTGKTILSIAAGLQMTLEEQIFQKVLIARPIMPLGKDIGYTPGTIQEKMDPWMRPVYDNIECLMNSNKKGKKANNSYQEFIDLGVLQVEPLTYIRGRSIPNQFMIVDECQNLSMHEVRTILTRMGDGSKIILTGDVNQIDNPHVDSESNGLTRVIEAFKNENISGHSVLSKGERSELAELSAKLLK